MATYYSMILFLFSIAFALTWGSNAQPNFKPRAFIFPTLKDNTTLQYYAKFDVGTPETYMNLVIDLGGEFIWFDCKGYNSSTYRPVRCGSSKCKVARGSSNCKNCTFTDPHTRIKCTCAQTPYNPYTRAHAIGAVREDTLSVYSTDGIVYLFHEDVPHLPLVCGDSNLLHGLASDARGIIGFGRTSQITLSTHLSLAFKVPRKFAFCLPSLTSERGDIFVGGGPYYIYTVAKDLSKSLIKTPLISTTRSDEYFINVKSIKVDGKVVSFNNTSLLKRTKLSTVTPYTVLHSAIYNALIKDFVKRASAKRMVRVEPVAPFGACFSSKNVASVKTGPVVPVIDLELEGNGNSTNTYWRIYGDNSMVRVKKNVMCLGFVDGGSKTETLIVIGGYQLEDRFIEFDLASSTVGLTPTLLLYNVTCNSQRLF